MSMIRKLVQRSFLVHLTAKSAKKNAQRAQRNTEYWTLGFASFAKPLRALRLSIWFLPIGYSLTVSAQDSLLVLRSDLVTIKEDARIADLMNEYKDYNRRKEFTDGYRIQIMYTDV